MRRALPPQPRARTPIWRGSGMAGVPLDLTLSPAGEGGAALLVLEDWGTGFRLVLYRWDAFGFRGEAWRAVGAGALATLSDGGTGFLPENEEQPCPLEISGRQLRLRCPRRRRKKSVSRAPHTSARTPAVTSTR